MLFKLIENECLQVALSLQNIVSVKPWLDHLHFSCLWLFISSQLNAYAILLLQKDCFKMSVFTIVSYCTHVTLCALVMSVGTQKYIHMKVVCRRLACHLLCRVCLIEQALADGNGNYRLFPVVWKGDEITVIWTGKFYLVSANLARSNLGMAECKLLATIEVYPVWRLSDCYYSRALKRARVSESDSKKNLLHFLPLNGAWLKC